MLLTKDDQYKIFMFYVGSNFKLSYAYLSPLPKSVRGKEDRFSSFNIYDTGEKLKWKDFGSGGKFGGDALDFIQIMERNINSPKEALDYYHKNIKNVNLIDNNLILDSRSKHKTVANNKKEPKLYYEKEFTPRELKYWNGSPYHVSKDRLLRERIYSLVAIDWGNGKVMYRDLNEPCFVFDFSENNDMSSWKMYRPLTKNKRKKWLSWNLSVIPFESYYLLPDKMENFCLCSGKKDSIITKVCLEDDFDCASPTGEGAYMSILDYVDEINERSKNQYILFDGDDAGIIAAKKLADLTKWKPIILDYPKLTGRRLHMRKAMSLPEFTKDVSEIVENYSYKKLFKLIKDKI